MILYVLIKKKTNSSEYEFVEGGGSSTPASPKVYKDEKMAKKMANKCQKYHKTYVHVIAVDIRLPS